MALVKPGIPMEMVLNEEARRKTPNLIIIKDNERLFGDAALAYVSVSYAEYLKIVFLIYLQMKELVIPSGSEKVCLSVLYVIF